MAEADLTGLWDRPRAPVTAAPFSHVLADGFLPDSLYRRLAASFPDCPPGSGPTGFTIHEGDEAFDDLMAGNEDWQALWRACDGPAFVRFVLATFPDAFGATAVDLSNAAHVKYRESRFDKERPRLAKVEHPADKLWVRFDMMQGRPGYDRAVHLDHRRRAATLLLYFADADETGAEGGDLMLHAADRTPAAVVRPKANRMVMFPCHNDSWHSVTPILSQNSPRNFLQVTLSSSVDLWPKARRPVGAAALDVARRVKARLAGA